MPPSQTQNQQQGQPQMTHADLLAAMIARSIGLTENGGKVDLKNTKAGGSGEMKSIFQYTPETWAADSKDIFGKELPLNNDTETAVAVGTVDKWLQAGYSPKQIFSMWNAGRGEPDAFSGKFSNGTPSKGTNKHGVAFDVPGYVNKATGYLDQMMKAESKGVADTGTQQKPPMPTAAPKGAAPMPSTGLLGGLAKNQARQNVAAPPQQNVAKSAV